MAPPKVMLGQNRQNNTMTLRKGMTTRSQNAVLNNILKHTNVIRDNRIKRKAEASPTKEKTNKRCAFANITNAITTSLAGQSHLPKKTNTCVKPHLESNVTQKLATNAAQKLTTNTIYKSATNVTQKSITDAVEKVTLNTLEKVPLNTAKKIASNVVEKPTVEKVVTKVLPVKSKPLLRVASVIKKDEKVEVPNKVVNIRNSIEFEKSEDGSLYVSALEDISDSTRRTRRSSTNKMDENVKKMEKDEKNEPISLVKKVSVAPQLTTVPETKLPEGVLWDFDAENWLDPFQVSQYVMDIFEYLKQRESMFPISNYMEQQVCLTQWMRALLVDWMVEVQESFELNHETLYLAVKLVDLYLSKVTVSKETLQLLGAASLFIASKFDERIPPMVEDFLYICDGAYSQKELIRMEMNVLKVINFDLGIPLSYRFLRRYARCAKVSMPTLTLARYILEYSLMDYSMITYSDSKMAAAALLLALLMKDLGAWTPTLEYYSGYKLEDIKDICNCLNESLHKKHKETLMTVRNKYSHKIFFEVAKLPLKETLNI